MSDQIQQAAENDEFCLCGLVDDLGDGTCGNCGLRIMTEDDVECIEEEADDD